MTGSPSDERMKILVKNGADERTVDLSAVGEYTVGRSPDCAVCLKNDNSISRRHAILSLTADAILVVDVGSHGGTFLNGVRIESQVPVKAGDVLSVGGAKLTFLSEKAGGTKNRSDIGDEKFRHRFRDAAVLCTDEMLAFRSRIHAIILSRLNAGTKNVNLAADKNLAERAEQCLDQVLLELRHELPDGIPPDTLRGALLDELLRYGPISPMIDARDISEIMVNGPDRIFVESDGRLYETGVRFLNEQHLIQVIQRIVEPLGRHVDTASPMVDARLPDGSRVNAIIPPLALDGASMTIRKFAEKKLTTDDLISFGSMTRDMALFLEAAVKARQSILVSGGTGSGKTTLLNILSQFIPEGERLVTVEDSAELKLSHRNIVRLEARPANVEGKGRITIRDLVVNCLRMRPDRIIVGECRGAEALDMLQAMNTGHNGSLTTCHANSPRDALSRLENMVMMAGYELPSSAIREQIASAVDIIVQQERMGDGKRKITKIVEVTGREGDVIQMQDIFTFEQSGIGKNGEILGDYVATGNIPHFVEEQRRRGVLKLDVNVFVPKV